MYATVSDVQRYAGRPITATSQPAATQVQEFLRDVAAEINTALHTRGYPVPVPSTATAAWDTLRAMEAQGAACHALRVAVTGRRETDIAACSAYDAALAALRDGDTLLPGIDLSDDRGARVRSMGSATSRFLEPSEY